MTHTAHPNGISQRDSDPNLEAAELEVKRAEAAFSETLHDASEAGRFAAQSVAKAAKPVLIGAAVLATLGLAVFAFRGVRKPNPWRLRLQPPRPSILSEVVRAAVISLASTAVRRMGENYLLGPHAEQATPQGQSASPQPARSFVLRSP
jgi:hypothetical protein